MVASRNPRLIELWKPLLGKNGNICIRAIDEGEPEDPTLLDGLSLEQRKRYAEISHPYRRREWLIARSCELEVGTELEKSVSHTGDLVIVVGWNDGRPRGVDVERADRSISPASQRKFITEHELGMRVQPIEAWVIKEACFKANPHNEGTIIADYRITEFDPGAGVGFAKLEMTPSDRQGKSPQPMGFQFSIQKWDRWVAALAILAETDERFRR